MYRQLCILWPARAGGLNNYDVINICAQNHAGGKCFGLFFVATLILAHRSIHFLVFFGN